MNLAELVTTKPADDHGTFIGVGDWRLVVEALLPAHPDSLWGVARWGIDVWSGLEWTDLTHDVQGGEFARGAHEYMGRPRVGQLDLTLNSPAGKYSPATGDAKSVYFAAGTIIRIGIASASGVGPLDWLYAPDGSVLIDDDGNIFTVDDPSVAADGWIPQITTIVDTWEDVVSGLGAVQAVHITAYETLSSVATNERTATAPAGENDTFAERMERLLDNAGWEFGYDFPGLVPFPTAQPTTQDGNLLAELYLTSDSWRRAFRSHRDGRAIAYLPSTFYLSFSILDEFASSYVLGLAPSSTTADDTTFVAYDADSVRVVNNREHVINHARIGAVGYAVAERTHRSSVYKYRRRTFEQLDLIVADEFGNRAEAIAEDMVNGRGRHTLRVAEAVVSTSDRGLDTFLAVLAADIGDNAIYVPPGSTPGDPDAPHVIGRIESLTHRFTPRTPTSVTWQTVIGLVTTDIANMPAAILPEETFP